MQPTGGRGQGGQSPESPSISWGFAVTPLIWESKERASSACQRGLLRQSGGPGNPGRMWVPGADLLSPTPGATGTCSQQPCEGSDACHRGRRSPPLCVVLRVTVCLAGHFLLPVAVRGGVGGGFIASRAGAPAAPCTCRSTGLSSPSPAQLILWAHARRKSCRLRTDWVSVLKTGRVPSGLDSSGGGGKQAACRSHVLTCSGPRVPGAVLRFVPGRRQPGTCWL